MNPSSRLIERSHAGDSSSDIKIKLLTGHFFRAPALS
jgi:hypothetical protein